MIPVFLKMSPDSTFFTLRKIVHNLFLVVSLFVYFVPVTNLTYLTGICPKYTHIYSNIPILYSSHMPIFTHIYHIYSNIPLFTHIYPWLLNYLSTRPILLLYLQNDDGAGDGDGDGSGGKPKKDTGVKLKEGERVRNRPNYYKGDEVASPE